MTQPPRLDDASVDAALAATSSPWVRDGERLLLDRRFDSFAAGIAFVDAVAVLADAADHHPDFSIHYTEVRLTLWTHDVGGLTQRDLDLAAAIAAR